MSLERINPATIHPPAGYSHIVKARAGTTAYISGQVAIDPDGNIVGEGDIGTQAQQAFNNLRLAVVAAGGRVEQIAKVTTYVVDYAPEVRPALADARQAVFGDHPPASTLIGVQALALPQLLIEVEATVVMD